MADITVTPTGRLADLNQSSTIRTDISVTLIGQSLSLEQGTALEFEWRQAAIALPWFNVELQMWRGTPIVSTIQDVFITGQSLSLNRGSPIIFDFIPSSQSLALAQGTPSVIGDVGGTPSGQQLLLNQSPNIANDLTQTEVGQELTLAQGTVVTSTANETIISLVGQALSLNQSDPSIASTVIIINPASRLLVLTQSPNVVEEWLLNLIGQVSLQLRQGTPTVNIVNDTAAATNVNITGQTLTLGRGTPIGAVANFIPVGRQLILSFPAAVVRVNITEEIDGQSLSLNQGTPTVVSIPGVTAIAGIPLVLNRGIPIVSIGGASALTGQSLSLAQGNVTVDIGASVPIIGQQLTLSQGTPSLVSDADQFIFGQDLFLNQGSIDVQDAINVSVTILGQQLTLNQGEVAEFVSELNEEILGLDLVLNQGSVLVISSDIQEEIAEAGQQLVLNQGGVCVSIYGMADESADPVYIPDGIYDVEYTDDEALSPTYISEHCD